MITKAAQKDKQAIISLWKEAFPQDSQDFIDFYFTRKYKPEYTLVYKIDGLLIAALQMLPYTMNYYQQKVKISYISGASTLKNYQGKGIMRQLLKASFEEMYNNNIVFSTLIPQEQWLVDYYQSVNYQQLFQYCLCELSPQGTKGTVVEIALDKLEKAFAFFNKYANNRDFCVQKTFDDFQTMVEDYRLAKGKLMSVLDHEELVALCFCIADGNQVLVKDFLAKDASSRQLMIDGLSVAYQQPLVEVCRKGEKMYQKGMLRVINAQKALEIKSEADQQTRNLIVEDNDIVANNLIFSQNNTKDVCLLNPSELANFLFENHPPFMTLMLD